MNVFVPQALSPRAPRCKWRGGGRRSKLGGRGGGERLRKKAAAQDKSSSNISVGLLYTCHKQCVCVCWPVGNKNAMMKPATHSPGGGGGGGGGGSKRQAARGKQQPHLGPYIYIIYIACSPPLPFRSSPHAQLHPSLKKARSHCQCRQPRSNSKPLECPFARSQPCGCLTPCECAANTRILSILPPDTPRPSLSHGL